MEFCESCGMLKKRCRCNDPKFNKLAVKKTPNNRINKTKTKVKSKGNSFVYRPINKNNNIKSNILPNEDNNNTKGSFNNESNSYNVSNGFNSHLRETKSERLKKEYPNINNNIIDKFPFENPREGQFEIIQEIYDAINKGYKYIVLEAGTGTGKSVIAATLARMHADAFIFTMTKQLQEQYIHDFGEYGFNLVKGRQNFQCKDKLTYSSNNKDNNYYKGTCTERYGFSCDFKFTQGTSENEDSLGHAFRNNFWKSSNHCSYLEQKAEGVNSDIVVTNYDYGFLELNYVQDFINREIMILDEAHNLENKIMNLFELELVRSELEHDIKLKVINDEIVNMKSIGYESWLSFVKDVANRYSKESKKLKVKLETKQSKRAKLETEELISKIDKLVDEYDLFVKHVKKDPMNWIMVYDNESIKFKPIMVNKYVKDSFLKYADICVFMSATILDYKKFTRWLGLDEKEVYYKHVKTPFLAEKRPIEAINTVDMKYDKLKRNAPKTLDIINEILERHKNDKGLIHTTSYKCKDYLIKNLRSSRLISHDSQNRVSILNKFEKSNRPLVLLSPSMGEGVDLPYDKCRFQIIYKIPFPPLKDEQIDKRKKKDQSWYAYQTVMGLVQSYGRGMRAEDDHCYTYVIDERLRFFVEKSPIYRRLVPEFFKEAIRYD
ncbi:MAG: helicase C-terminal domain-containing protein [Methanobacteriaceae archaeon]